MSSDLTGSKRPHHAAGASPLAPRHCGGG